MFFFVMMFLAWVCDEDMLWIFYIIKYDTYRTFDRLCGKKDILIIYSVDSIFYEQQLNLIESCC